MLRVALKVGYNQLLNFSDNEVYQMTLPFSYTQIHTKDLRKTSYTKTDTGAVEHMGQSDSHNNITLRKCFDDI